MKCKHRRTPENTYVLKDGVRRCRTCISEVLRKKQEIKGLPPDIALLLPSASKLQDTCVWGHLLPKRRHRVRAPGTRSRKRRCRMCQRLWNVKSRAKMKRQEEGKC